MIRLRTLGSIGLSADSGADLAPVLRQPKRFALFLYLALARPRGFQRRESLMALFWPELDAERARASLRQALYTLRRQLPDGVLENRGDAELSLAAGRLESDVALFEAHIAAGEPEAALRLYGGPLLPGFHVPDASPELEYWIDGERARLHAMAVGAAADACEAAESRGDLAEAVRWAARAVELAPLDEEAARREIELLHRAGDRAGALLTFEQSSARLEAELGLTPDPATLALVERVRTEPVEPPARAHAWRGPAPDPTRAGVAVLDPPAEPAREQATVRPEPSREPPTPEPRPRRRALQAAFGLVLALGLAVLAVILPVRLDWSDGAAATAGNRVMVLPFSYRGAGEASYLSEGLVYLFSVAMDGDELRTMDPNGLIRRVGADGRESYDVASAAALADEAGASYFLLGSVVETGGGLQVTASLYHGDQRAPVARGSASGSSSEVLELVDAIAGELLTSRAGPSSSRITRLAAVTSHSLPSLKAYLRGERLIREGRYDEAIESLGEAIAGDSAFALAHYRMSQAASWAFRGDLATRSAATAVRHADRLPEHERRLLMGHEAYRQGDGAGALEMLRDLSVHYPDDPEVWYRLGEVRMHYGPLHGWSIRDARDPFRRAIELDPSYTDAIYHLAQLATLAGDTAGALDYIAQSLESAPDGARAPQLRVLRTLLDGESSWRDRLADLAAEDDFTLISSLYTAAVYGGRIDRAREIARMLVDAERPHSTRTLGRLILAELALATGRAEAARGHFAALESLDPDFADRYAALLVAAPGARPDVETLRARLERLSIDRAATRPGGVIWRLDELYAPNPRLYAVGILATILGREEVLAEAMAGLERDSTIGQDYAQDLRLLAAEQGMLEGATSEPPRFDRPVEDVVLTPFLSRPARRLHEARRLEQSGRLREALVWYESLASFSVHDLPWGVPALLDRARIHERLGEDAEAAVLYQRFAELWSQADDPGPRNEALARLSRLRAPD